MMASVDDREWDEALGLTRWEESPAARDALGARVRVERGGETAVYRVADVVFGEDGGETYTFVRVG